MNSTCLSVALVASGLLASALNAADDPSRSVRTGLHGSFTQTKPDPVPAAAEKAIAEIIAAARKGDEAALLARISDEAVVSFGMGDGHAGFLELWRDPGTEPFARFADALEITTALGATVLARGQLRYPFYTWIVDDTVEPYLVMLADEGSLHTEPSSAAPVLDVSATDSILCLG